MSLEDAAGQKAVSRKTFRDDDMSGFSIFETEFSNCEFVNCIFDGGRIGLSQFYDCRFANCSFRGANLQSCLFNNADGERRCVWSGCDLSDAMLVKCNLTNNALTACKGFNLRIEECNASGAKMKIDAHRYVKNRLVIGGLSCHRTKFYEADFKEQNLESSVFELCDLRSADFSGCNLSSANFAGANLNNARLSAATLSGAIIAHATIDELDVSGILSIDDLGISQDQQEKILAQFRIRVLN